MWHELANAWFDNAIRGSHFSHPIASLSQGLDREGMTLIEQQDADGFRKCAWRSNLGTWPC